MKPSNWTAWTIFPSRSASFTMALLQDLQDALDDFAYSAPWLRRRPHLPSPTPRAPPSPLPNSGTFPPFPLSEKKYAGAITWRK
ncbi:unnamed protein product [Spirodela intermedia]|uniref:Uncharacterized protein n=1 Tax=Spirodela intermedia TaxID=51605 RepID=A0A7I8IZX4_SPIIN|nr:unnamed protein product [Spirodela intermedia]CAA6662610.1 unnamed protein product [Spirodela intermedia]